MRLDLHTRLPNEEGWPIPADATTANPVTGGRTEYERHGNAWWIVRRDGYRQAYICNGPHKSKNAAIAAHCSAFGY